MSSKLRTASWVLLAIVGVLVLLASLASAQAGYLQNFAIGGVAIVDVASGREAVLIGLRGARGTAAAWGAAWAVLFLAVVFGPYKRGDVATWWGILLSALTLGAVAGARVVFIGNQAAGTGTPLVLLVIVILALLLDVKRLAQPHP